MLHQRLSIACICAYGRYFWLYLAIVQDMCGPAEPYYCITSTNYYTKSWYLPYLLAYLMLIVCDLHILPPRYSMNVKIVLFLILIHTYKTLSLWSLVDLLDAVDYIIVDRLQRYKIALNTDVVATEVTREKINSPCAEDKGLIELSMQHQLTLRTAVEALAKRSTTNRDRSLTPITHRDRTYFRED